MVTWSIAAVDRWVDGSYRRIDSIRIAGELDADGLVVAGREDVDDPAAHGELAVLVRRVFAAESRLDEMLAEELRVDFGPEPQREHGRGQPARRDQAWQQRRRGRDDDAHVAGGDRRKHPRACGRHVKVRREPAVRVHLVRGQRQHGGCGRAVVEALECRQEESRVGRGFLGVRVGGDDKDDQSITRLMRAKRRVQARVLPASGRRWCRDPGRSRHGRRPIEAEPEARGTWRTT